MNDQSRNHQRNRAETPENHKMKGNREQNEEQREAIRS